MLYPVTVFIRIAAGLYGGVFRRRSFQIRGVTTTLASQGWTGRHFCGLGLISLLHPDGFTQTAFRKRYGGYRLAGILGIAAAGL